MAAIAAPSAHPPKRKPLPVETPEVIGNTQRMGLCVA
jgi:hypothetical protein